MNDLILVQPEAEYAEQIAEYRAEFPVDLPRVTYFADRIPGLDHLEEYKTVEEWLDYIQTMQGKITWFMAVRRSDQKIVGFSCLRHKLEYDDDDIDFASNIGYSIRPGERRKGYAKEQLRLVLQKAKALGLDTVRIVCSDSNEGSNRTIAACGGRYVDSLHGEESGITINRYDVKINNMEANLMPEIIKVFKEEIPNLRFIGKKYDDFGHWGEWWENGWFDLLEQTMGGPEQILNIWENGGGYIGVERRAEGQPFAYYIGMLTPEETPVPEGFVCIDFEGLSLGTCWIYGKESEVHDTSACRGKLEAQGIRVWKDADGAEWSFENCLCPRYTTPDEQGNVILDYCYFVHKQDADAVVDSRCGLHCIGCEFKEPYHCGGCIETNGHPFHGECPVAVCCQEKGFMHCGECEQMPCELLTQYSCDPEHGDTPSGARIEQCKRWKESEVHGVAK